MSKIQSTVATLLLVIACVQLADPRTKPRRKPQREEAVIKRETLAPNMGQKPKDTVVPPSANQQQPAGTAPSQNEAKPQATPQQTTTQTPSTEAQTPKETEKRKSRFDPDAEDLKAADNLPDSTDSSSTLDALKHKLSSFIHLASETNNHFYMGTIDFVEAKIVPIWAFLKERTEIGAFILALLNTLLFLKLLSFIFGKKRVNSGGFDTSKMDEQFKNLNSNLGVTKTDLEKSVTALTAKVTDLQKTLEKFMTDKKDEEPLEFLFGNLGDLWKEIRDLKTRVNEADVGSNLISFNSKMEFKNADKKDKVGLDDLEDDSTSRKNVGGEISNRILPRDIFGQPPTTPQKEEPQKTEDNPTMDPEVIQPPPIRASPAKFTRDEPPKPVSRLEMPSMPQKSMPRLPTTPSIDPSKVPSDTAGAPEDEDRPQDADARTPQQTGATDSNKFVGSNDFDATPRQDQDAPAELKMPSLPPKIAPPVSMLPKTQPKKPQMIRAMPPRAPPGAPVPKPADSNNLI